VTGTRLSELRAESGQFFLWRFLTREGWWQAHPYSLSAAPNGGWLRLTAKDLGDHSAGLAALHRGTRVMAEGPYGAFSAHRRTRKRVLLIGAGVGMTPLRALFESLPGAAGDISLVYRARTADEVIFRQEIDAIAQSRGAQVHYLIGSRRDHPELLTGARLSRLVPDLARRDIYVCGPAAMAAATTVALREAGVPRRQIHREHFEL